MATFSPTLQFSKRWLSAPSVVKQAFHQELDDIIHMLGSDVSAKDYQFTHQDFGGTVAQMLDTYANEPAEPAKLVHSIDTTPLSMTDNTSQFDEDLTAIETRIREKLSVQIDDFLAEHLTQLSADLKSWLNTAIKNELSNHQKPENR